MYLKIIYLIQKIKIILNKNVNKQKENKETELLEDI